MKEIEWISTKDKSLPKDKNFLRLEIRSYAGLEDGYIRSCFYSTEEGVQQFLDIINGEFSFDKI